MAWNEANGRFEGSTSKSAVTDITIPANAGDNFVIGGRVSWDPAIYVEWVYTLQ